MKFHATWGGDFHLAISTLLQPWQNVTVWHAHVVGPMAWVPFARNPIARRNFWRGGTFFSTWLAIVDV
jgi:hypothetical protein